MKSLLPLCLLLLGLLSFDASVEARLYEKLPLKSGQQRPPVVNILGDIPPCSLTETITASVENDNILTVTDISGGGPGTGPAAVLGQFDLASISVWQAYWNVGEFKGANMPLKDNWVNQGFAETIQAGSGSTMGFCNYSISTSPFLHRGDDEAQASNAWNGFLILTPNTSFSRTTVNYHLEMNPPGLGQQQEASVVRRGWRKLGEEWTATDYTISFSMKTPTDEAIVGLGEQYNKVDMRGNSIPVFTREQGVGRGLEPLTFILNLDDFIGGDLWTTYGARPVFMSSGSSAAANNNSRLFSMLNAVFSRFDCTQEGAVTISVNDTRAWGVIGSSLVNSNMSNSTAGLTAGQSDVKGLLASISLWTEVVGRPRLPPTWSYEGAIVGFQGGTEAVLTNLTALENLDAPMSAFWLQDWTGPRPLDLRLGLWWNWEWNPTHYPNYTQMIATLASKNIKTMVYLNPMLVNASTEVGHKNNFWKTGMEKGYFITHGPENKPWVGYNGGSLIDFTNPEAKSWYKGIIKNALLTNVSGWMADFGEAVPLDSNLYDKSIQAKQYHNQYPDEWFKVNREAVSELGLDDDIFFFGRSAWLKSAHYYSAGWQGDQLCNFDNFDGIGSAVTSLLSSGISGTPYMHSDIGGYNALLGYKRTEELFLRWCELAAFTTFFRSHDGSNPHTNWQFYRTEDTRKQFVRYAKLFKAWHFYRKTLVEEGAALGLPVARALVLHYPHDPNTFNLTLQYMVGSEMLVAPVVTKGATTVELYIPSGSCWTHVWSNKNYTNPDGGNQMVSVQAPIGSPAVFVRCGSAVGAEILKRLTSVQQ